MLRLHKSKNGILLLLALCMLAGCGRRKEEPVRAKNEELSEAPRQAFDWRREAIAQPGALAEGEASLYYTEYVPYSVVEPQGVIEYSGFKYAMSGNRLYGILKYGGIWEGGESSEKTYLLTVNGETRESNCCELDLLGLCQTEGIASLPQLCDAFPGQLVFTTSGWKRAEEGSDKLLPEHYYVVYTDLNAKAQKKMDLGKEFIELGFMKESDDPNVLQKCYAGISGNCYTWDKDFSKLYCMDGTGVYQELLDFSQQPGEFAVGMGKAWDGTLLFFCLG